MGLQARALANLYEKEAIYRELLQKRISDTLDIPQESIVVLKYLDGILIAKIDGLVLADIGSGNFTLGKFCEDCNLLVVPRDHPIKSLSDLSDLLNDYLPYCKWHQHRNLIGGKYCPKFLLE